MQGKRTLDGGKLRAGAGGVVTAGLIQTCQPLIKENLETHEKKSGDSIKNSEILFFSRSRLNKPLFHRGKSLTVYLNVLFVFPWETPGN